MPTLISRTPCPGAILKEIVYNGKNFGGCVSKRPGFLFNIAVFIFAGLALFIYAYVGSYSRYLADDYCVAYMANRLGLLRSIWYWYISWSGGFSASALDWLLTMIKPEGMPYVTPTVIILWLLITTIAIALLLPKEGKPLIKWPAAIALAGTSVFSILLTTPDVDQSLFWWSGMRAYISPLLIATLYIALYQLAQATIWDRKRFFFWGAISFSITFFNGGFSETFTPLQVLILAFALGLGMITRNIKYKGQSFIFLLAGLIGAILSLITMVAAPGNAARQGFFPPPPGIIGIISISISGFIPFLGDVFGTPERIAGLIGFTLLALKVGMETYDGKPPKWWSWLLTLATGFIASFLCFPPAAFGMSEAPANRTLTFAVFTIVASLLHAGLISGKWIASKNKWTGNLSTIIALLVIALLGFSTLKNAQSLYLARSEYIEYAEKWDEMNSKIIEARTNGEDLVTIPVIRNWANLNTPNENPNFWATYCMSSFYGIDIRAIEQSSP